MAIREIVKGVHSVGAIDWDRRIFDELIPLPDGTSYNSYLIKGSDKTALIDTVDPTKTGELLANLKKSGIKRIDYVIANHAEQDHSGSLPDVLKAYPEAKVVTNEKCKSFLTDLLHIAESRFQVVKDGEILSLGNKTLEFIFTPWVHWPETLVTYLHEDKMLFSCDFFGSHLATDDLFACCDTKLYEGAKRYYAEIMMPFRKLIQVNLKKLGKYRIAYIAPSHGPVYNKPEFIIDAYGEWVSDDVKPQVVIAYVSMHGSTDVMVKRLVASLEKHGMKVVSFNLPKADIGELAIELVDASTIVIASPTVLTGPHPAAISAAYLASALRPKAKFAAIIGSYGWGGQMAEILKSVMPGLQAELLPPLLVKGLPREADLKAIDALAEVIVEKNKALKLTK